MHLDPFELHRPTTVEEVGRARRASSARASTSSPGAPTSCRTTRCTSTCKPHLISPRGVDGASGAHASIGSARWPGSPTSSGTPSWPGIPGTRRGRSGRSRPRSCGSSATVGREPARRDPLLLLQPEPAVAAEPRLLPEGRRRPLPRRPAEGALLRDLLRRPRAGPRGARCRGRARRPRTARRRLPVLDLYDPGGRRDPAPPAAPGEIVVAVHLPTSGATAVGELPEAARPPAFDFPELGLAAAGAGRGRDRPVGWRSRPADSRPTRGGSTRSPTASSGRRSTETSRSNALGRGDASRSARSTTPSSPRITGAAWSGSTFGVPWTGSRHPARGSRIVKAPEFELDPARRAA